MNIQSCARMTASGRALLVRRVREEGWTPAEAAEAFEISVRTVFKWLGRFDEEGPTGLLDRSSRPRRSPFQVPRDWQDAIIALRQFKMTGEQIARRLRLPRSTVARVLSREGLGRLKYLDPPLPV